MPNVPLVVPKLTVGVVTGETCYPGENGFSSISAEVSPENPALVERLVLAQKSRELVTLRCAMLDTTGRITNCLNKEGRKVFIQVVDDVIYRKPGSGVPAGRV